ncbi:MAG: T9SS type A sorting domain-containing protein [Rufibacter sp.]
MLKPLQKISFLLVAGLGLGSLSANAQTLYEPFTGAGVLVGYNNWINHNGTSGQLAKVAGSLTYSGLPTSQGDKLVIKATDAEDANVALPAAVTTGNIYASMLIKVTDGTTQLANTTTGNYFFHFAGDGGVSATASPYVTRLSIRAGSAANTFNLGVLNSSSGTTGNTEADIFGSTPTNYNVGETYLVVVKYNMATNTSSIWVNPATGSTETNPLISNNSGTASTRISTVAIRQSNTNTQQGTGNMEIDELRSGTTWASVTPGPLGVKEFSAGNVGFFPNPTSGTSKLTLPAGFAKSNVDLTVYSPSGQVILKASGSEKVLNEKLSTALKSAAAGVYVLKVDGNGESFQTRIVKN